MQNARLDEAQAGIKIAERNINNLRYVHDTTLMAERGIKEAVDESERGEWKSWLKTQHSENEDHGIWSHHFMTNRWGNNGNSDRLCFLGVQNHCSWWLQPWNWNMLAPWKKSYDQPRQHIRKQRHYFADQGPSSQSYDFSNSQVWICKLDYKESWVPKNWCFWTVVLKKTLWESLGLRGDPTSPS